MEYKGYTARVEFDEEASILFGEVEGLRDVVTFEATNVKDLTVAFHDSIDDYLAMCAEAGEEPEKPYSGKFLVRVDPRLHRDLSMAAARAGVSLNQFTGELFKSALLGARAGERQNESQAPNATGTVDGRLGRFDAPKPAPSVVSSRERSTVWQQSTHTTPSSLTPNTPGQSLTPPRKIAA